MHRGVRTLATSATSKNDGRVARPFPSWSTWATACPPVSELSLRFDACSSRCPSRSIVDNPRIDFAQALDEYPILVEACRCLILDVAFVLGLALRLGRETSRWNSTTWTWCRRCRIRVSWSNRSRTRSCATAIVPLVRVFLDAHAGSDEKPSRCNHKTHRHHCAKRFCFRGISPLRTGTPWCRCLQT